MKLAKANKLVIDFSPLLVETTPLGGCHSALADYLEMLPPPHHVLSSKSYIFLTRSECYQIQSPSGIFSLLSAYGS